MQSFLFAALAYIILPLWTLYTCFASIYLLDFSDPDFFSYLVLWIPGIFLYYIYIGQLIIGQRLPLLDRIWGFPNIIRKHRGLFRYMLLLTLILHSAVHLKEDGLRKVLLEPDSGMIVVYVSVVVSILLMIVAVRVWLKPRNDKLMKVADYAKMHRLHQSFYLLAAGVWYHVFTAGALEENLWGKVLVTGYLLFALGCKLCLMISQATAPVYRLESVEVLHENFVRLRLRVPNGIPNKRARRRIGILHQHQAGQYAYFSFALVGPKGKTYWEQHPFSFAGYARKDSESSDTSVLTVVVKKLGDFTARLSEWPADPLGTQVKVLGPYGKFSCQKAAYSDGIHLVAAGAGITPFLSMLEQMAFEAKSAGQSRSAPLNLHWFVHEASELVFEDRFHYFQEQLPHLSIHTYAGARLTEGKLRDVLSSQPPSRKTGVLYCGPGAVVPTLRKVMSGLGMPRTNFHTELFSM